MTGDHLISDEQPYRIALRSHSHNDPARMDDIVVKDVKLFRAEQTNPGWWWVCLDLGDAGVERITFAVAATDWRVEELPDVHHRYEPGSYGSGATSGTSPKGFAR